MEQKNDYSTSPQVGKTSIIDQFMSSEHADVYVDNFVCPEAEDREVRCGRSVLNSQWSGLVICVVYCCCCCYLYEVMNYDCDLKDGVG